MEGEKNLGTVHLQLNTVFIEIYRVHIDFRKLKRNFITLISVQFLVWKNIYTLFSQSSVDFQADQPPERLRKSLLVGGQWSGWDAAMVDFLNRFVNKPVVSDQVMGETTRNLRALKASSRSETPQSRDVCSICILSKLRFI